MVESVVVYNVVAKFLLGKRKRSVYWYNNITLHHLTVNLNISTGKKPLKVYFLPLKKRKNKMGHFFLSLFISILQLTYAMLYIPHPWKQPQRWKTSERGLEQNVCFRGDSLLLTVQMFGCKNLLKACDDEDYLMKSVYVCYVAVRRSFCQASLRSKFWLPPFEDFCCLVVVCSEFPVWLSLV